MQHFTLANPIYVGAVVSFFTIDGSGDKTTNLATLYTDEIGVEELSNPQDLDGDGKLQQPTYFDEPVIASVAGLTIPDHDTGIVYTAGSFRGDWATATVYYPLDVVIAATAADGTNDVYIINARHTSGTFATDLGNGLLSQLVDMSDITAANNIPAASAPNALKYIRVNTGGTAYEFITIATLAALVLGEDLDILYADIHDVITKSFGYTKSTLADAATVTPVLENTQAFNWAVGGSRTLGFPSTVPGDAGTYYIDATVDVTGGYTLTLDSGYNLVSGVFNGSANAVNRIWLTVRSASIIDVNIENL